MSKKDEVLEAFINEPGKVQIPDSYLDRYLKFRDIEKILDNSLLGDFVGEQYVISPEIKKELVERKKILTEWTEIGLKADMNVGSRIFHLELEIREFDTDREIASLYLVEKVYDEKWKSFIADFVDRKSLRFKENAMAVFNILLEEDDKQYDELDSIKKRLEAQKNKNNAERKFMVEMYSELYVLRMLKILSTCGPVGKKVLEEYSAEIKNKGYTGTPTPDLYIKLRKVLDDTIEKNGGIKEITKQNPQVKVALKEFVDPMEYYEKVSDMPIVAPTKKPAEKTGTKKSPQKDSGGGKKGGKSGGGKSGGGGGNKPKGNKKSEKKDEKKKTYYLPSEEYKNKTETVKGNATSENEKPNNTQNGLNEVDKEKTSDEFTALAQAFKPLESISYFDKLRDGGNIESEFLRENFNEQEKKDLEKNRKEITEIEQGIKQNDGLTEFESYKDVFDNRNLNKYQKRHNKDLNK